MKKWLLGSIALLMGLGLLGNTPVQAAKYTVKIGSTTAFKEFLHISPYYRTTKAVKAQIDTNPITRTSTAAATQTLTIPKGTVLAANNIANRKVYQIDAAQLSYGVLKPLIKKGVVPTDQFFGKIKASAHALTKVARPAYLPAYSYGDLYPGQTTKAINHVFGEQAGPKVLLTSDGYLERHVATNSKANQFVRLQLRPQSSAKIQKTTIKGATRYLYFKTKVAGIPTKHVRSTGNYRYRLTLTNRHQPIYQQGNSDDDGAGSFYSLYRLGQQPYFTPLGNDGSGD